MILVKGMKATAEFVRFFLSTLPVLGALLIHPAKVHFADTI
jgi:hypothetical protein